MTNFASAIRAALDQLEALDSTTRASGSSTWGGHYNRHILLITDGHPTAGDRHCTTERLRAAQMGVVLHTM